MPAGNLAVHVTAVAVAAGALLGATAAPATAWPITLTAEDTNYLNQVRGVFPGDDDQLLLVGRQICRGLMTGQGTQAVTDSTAAQYGASPDQAAVAVRAAHGTYCTSAPG
jgi:hypothetical protein